MSVTLVADPEIPGCILSLMALQHQPGKPSLTLRFLCSVNGFDGLI